MKLKQEMRILTRRMVELIQNHPDFDRMHHDVCAQLCDEFDLWEKVYGKSGHEGYQLPMWVMWLVSSCMHGDKTEV